MLHSSRKVYSWVNLKGYYHRAYIGALSAKFPQVSFPKTHTVSIFLRIGCINLCLLPAVYEIFGIWDGGFSTKNKIQSYGLKKTEISFTMMQRTLSKGIELHFRNSRNSLQVNERNGAREGHRVKTKTNRKVTNPKNWKLLLSFRKKNYHRLRRQSHAKPWLLASLKHLTMFQMRTGHCNNGLQKDRTRKLQEE